MSAPRASLIVLADRPWSLRLLLAALELQTEPSWEALVLDQGDRASTEVSTAYCSHYTRDRSRLCYEPVARRGDWGQTEKMAAIARVSGEWVGFPNDDAYYCPAYLELMLAGAERAGADLVYCDWVSAKDMGVPYEVYEARPQTGYIDVGGFLVRRSVIQAHGWPDRGPTGDGALIESLVAAGVPHVRVPHVLYTKN